MMRNGRSVRAMLVGMARIGMLGLALVVTGPHGSWAQSPAAPAVARVPTIKLLAIGSFTAGTTPQQWTPILPDEVRDTVRLYLSGKIDQWYVKQDQTGVVFVMNLTDPQEAHELLEKLPLGRAGLMQFQLIPLGPISPLRLLLSEPVK